MSALCIGPWWPRWSSVHAHNLGSLLWRWWNCESKIWGHRRNHKSQGYWHLEGGHQGIHPAKEQAEGGWTHGRSTGHAGCWDDDLSWAAAKESFYLWGEDEDTGRVESQGEWKAEKGRYLKLVYYVTELGQWDIKCGFKVGVIKMVIFM